MASYHWEVRWLRFEKGVSFEAVNAVIADLEGGWEPFGAMPDGENGWVLLVRRKRA